MKEIGEFWIHSITHESGGTTLLGNGAFLREYCDGDWRFLKKVEDGWIPMKVAVPDGMSAVEIIGMDDILIEVDGLFRNLDDLLVPDKNGHPALLVNGETVTLRECLYGPSMDVSGKEDE